jgi:poly(3-hydroxybutyrate) depolymerase
MNLGLKRFVAALVLVGASFMPGWAREASFACPAGFIPKEGLNTNFPSDGLMRAFVVTPAQGVTGPAPAWVPMTGTVEATTANLTSPRSGATAAMAVEGFTVIGPVRQCANQDPDIGFAPCNGPGHGGWNWTPWNDGRTGNAEGEKWKQVAGPDADFLKEMVQCVGTKFPLDPTRLYLGGISAGGTMTNRALAFDSDFWAGGMPISGEWYISADDGSYLDFASARAAVKTAPTKIFQGRAGPFPLKSHLDPMIVLTVWGGDKDTWDCGPPMGLCADYRPATQASSNYFASIPTVVHVACTVNDGHMWPQIHTQDFNAWALRTLASHPKGSDKSSFQLTQPPEGYSCHIGAYTDHY